MSGHLLRTYRRMCLGRYLLEAISCRMLGTNEGVRYNLLSLSEWIEEKRADLRHDLEQLTRKLWVDKA